MELAVSARPYRHSFPSFFSPNPPSPFLTKPFPSPKHHHKRLRQKRLVFRASASGNPNGSDAFSWPSVSRSIRRGSERALSNLSGSLKRATGFDLEHANRNISGLVDGFWDAIKKEESAFNRFRFELFPAFVDWNRLERWKVRMGSTGLHGLMVG